MKTPLEEMSAKTYTASNGTTLPYRLYVPEEMSVKNPAFLLFLHGAGERGDDNIKQVKYNYELLERVINDEKLSKECIIAAPQCPEENRWANTPWENGSYSLKDTPVCDPMQAADELVDYIIDKYDVDKTRVYIAGISMGGFGTWNMIMRRPKLFAAAVPVCGGADPKMAEIVKDIPIRTFHSKGDPVVPVKGTREMVAALKEINGNIAYKEYESNDHNCWTDAFHEPDLTDWLFSQRNYRGKKNEI